MAQRRSSSRRPPHRSDEHRRDGRKNRQPAYDTPCPVCGEVIFEISSAITEKLTGQPAHFECIIKKIAEEENIQEDETICYLGNGSFGIIQKRNSKQMTFFIRKRIQYEDKDVKKDWRRNLVRTDEQYKKKGKTR